MSEGCYRYQHVLADENQEIADWLLRLTANQRNWGFGLCFLYLRNVKGFGWNHKRVYRIYRALELMIGWRGKPAVIRWDNGPEYISEELKRRAMPRTGCGFITMSGPIWRWVAM